MSQPVGTLVCPFCLIDVPVSQKPDLVELLDYRQTRTFIERELDRAGHLDWHAEQMARTGEQP